MPREKKETHLSIPDRDKLLSLIAQLDERTLYTRAFRVTVGVEIAYREGCQAGYSSYSKVDGSAVEDYLGNILPNPCINVKLWNWFDPSPIGMPEGEIETLVQRRLMKPLTIQGEPSGTAQWRIEIYVVPESVLRRPPSPETGYYYGEPWCKQCNDTFFWSPNVKSAFWSPIYQGALCHSCMGRMPVDYHRPRNYQNNPSWQQFMAKRAANWPAHAQAYQLTSPASVA